MFTMPLHHDILVTSVSDASTLNLKKRMTEIMNHVRDSSNKIGGSAGSLVDGIAPRSGETTPQKIYQRSLSSSHEGSPAGISKPHGINQSKSTGNYSFKRSSSSSNIVTINDISPNNSQFFEVMYIGKIKVSHKRVPFTFIDDALPKFKAYDAQRLQKIQDEQLRRNSSASEGGSIENVSFMHKNSMEEKANYSSDEGKPKDLKIVEDNDPDASEMREFKDKILNTKLAEEQQALVGQIHPDKRLMRGQSHMVLPVMMKKEEPITESPNEDTSPDDEGEPVPKQRDRSASIGSIPIHEQNRTMVFLVGKSDIRLISPDKKQILLYKDFKDITTCVQGHKNSDHFGIICREEKTDGYIGYVFKCQSEDFANDIVASISQAFNNSCLEKKSRDKLLQNYSCDHCPMLWYHKLVTDVEGMSEKKVHATIFRRIDMLSDDEQEIIMAKYYGAEDIAEQSLFQRNCFLMLMLKAHCESRQQRHVHDTAENRSEFLNQYLGGSTIFMKAKRSLSSSFDHLLKRKGSKDDFGHMGLVNEPAPDPTLKRNNSEGRTVGKSSSNNSSRKNSDELKEAPAVKAPMMDIFLKVGNNPKIKPSGSWRQEILNRVVSSNDLQKYPEATNLISSLRPAHSNEPHEKRTAKELRNLWRTAIKQVIILQRMEKENASLQARHNENEIRKIKLDYDEICTICDKQATEMWDAVMDRDHRQATRRDPQVILQAIKNGVPRHKRGDIWMFLAHQNTLNTAPVDVKSFPNYNTPYSTLLKRLTEHQHAIFIDLGRTFPNHRYYKQSMGIGQLSLFNLLKAYSILDPELGYCQGLGFICGVLLLHLEENDAFEMLKHLMFRRQMRNKYLPDMRNFQLQLYQMSRLLKDYLPDLYECFDRNDISPTLYAAPWILTIFSSQFPLGFVTRVFDFIFLESSEVIFKFALSLLEVHKDEIMECESFEDIMEYLKEIVPKVDADHLEKIMKKVFTMNISRKLTEYQVEYNVLQEEITSQNHHLENLKRSKEENFNLTNQLQDIRTQLEESEKSRFTQQKQIKTLQTQVQGLDVTVDVLGQFILELMDNRHDIEFPGEVRRIVQQLNQLEQRKTKPKVTDRKMGKSKSVSSHLGFPLRVLEELNENFERDTVPPTSPILESKERKKVSYFENTYDQLRQQKLKLNSTARLIEKDENELNDDVKLPEHTAKLLNEMPRPAKDLKQSQPVTVIPPSHFEPVIVAANQDEYKEDVHPLSNMGGDINFTFNGTTQLKSIRPIHGRSSSTNNLSSISGSDYDKAGRS